MNKGWFKTHRELYDKPIWTGATPEQKVVLSTILKMANYEAKEWEWNGMTYSVQPGQFITSLKSLKEECGKGLTIQKIRTALNRLETYGFLTNESTNRNRLITIVNWHVYQQNGSQPKKEITNGQPNYNKQITTTKNYKKEKNIRNSSFFQKLQATEFQLDLTKGEA